MVITGLEDKNFMWLQILGFYRAMKASKSMSNCFRFELSPSRLAQLHVKIQKISHRQQHTMSTSPHAILTVDMLESKQ